MTKNTESAPEEGVSPQEKIREMLEKFGSYDTDYVTSAQETTPHGGYEESEELQQQQVEGARALLDAHEKQRDWYYANEGARAYYVCTRNIEALADILKTEPRFISDNRDRDQKARDESANIRAESEINLKFYPSGKHVIIGGSPWELDKLDGNPTDFLGAYDKAVSFFDRSIKARISHYGDIDESGFKEEARKLYQLEAEKGSDSNLLIMSGRGLAGEEGGPNYVVCRAKDLPEELALEILMKEHTSLVSYLYAEKEKRRRVEESLSNFADTAEKEDDYATALRARQRLGMIDDAFLQKVSGKIESLQSPQDEDAKREKKELINAMKEVSEA
jgi:hypothetical protein